MYVHNNNYNYILLVICTYVGHICTGDYVPKSPVHNNLEVLLIRSCSAVAVAVTEGFTLDTSIIYL